MSTSLRQDSPISSICGSVDALETLKDLKGGVSMAFLDGWKEPLSTFLRMIETSLQAGALVVADDLDLFPEALRDCLAYVRGPARGYVSVKLPIGDAMELSGPRTLMGCTMAGQCHWISEKRWGPIRS